MSDELEEEVTKLIATYLEGLHNPRDDSLYNELRAKRDTEKLKDAIKALIASRVQEALEHNKAKKFHLKKDDFVSFCGWGTESGVEFVEIVEDATCKTCIRLKQLKSGTGKEL